MLSSCFVPKSAAIASSSTDSSSTMASMDTWGQSKGETSSSLQASKHSTPSSQPSRSGTARFVTSGIDAIHGEFLIPLFEPTQDRVFVAQLVVDKNLRVADHEII